MITVIIGMKFIQQTYGASPVWPATGLFAFYVIKFDKKYLPVIPLSYFLGQLVHGAQIENIFLGTLGTSFEALFIYSFRSKLFNKERTRFNIEKTVLIFVISVFACSISALFGTYELFRSHIINNDSIIPTFFSWLLGDNLGFLFLTPTLIVFSELGLKNFLQLFVKSYRSIIISFISIWLIFNYSFFNPAIFILFIILTFIAGMDGKKGIFSTNILVYIVSITMTLNGKSPFNFGSPTENLIALQTLLFSFSIYGYGLSEIGYKKLIPSLKFSLICVTAAFSVVYFFLFKSEIKKDELNFSEKVSIFKYNLNTKLETYANFLDGAKSFYLTRENVSDEEFAKYASSLNLFEKYPGINGIGIVKYFDKEQFKSAQKKYPIRFLEQDQGDEIGAHYIITNIEPININKSARGLDLSSEKTRLIAAQIAKNKNITTITGPITLVQDNQKRPGFLMFAPLRNEKGFIGWTYSPFITSNFLAPLIPSLKEEIEIDINAKNKDNAHQKIFSNKKDYFAYQAMKKTIDLNFGDNYWHITLSSTPKFASERWRISSWIMLLSSLTLLITLAGLASIHNTTLTAEHLAQDLSQKLFQSSKLSALGEMAAGIAHEINNPIFIIHGKTELLLRKFENKAEIDPKDAEEKLRTILKTASRISAIVKGLKGFSRDNEGDPYENESLQKIITETIDFCIDRYKVDNIKLSIEGNQDFVILCRKVQVQQAILNLLNNAADAISAVPFDKWVKIIINSDEKNIYISVINSGPKIPIEIADKIMEPFFTTKSVGKGTGLGLSISRNIMEAHQGKLSLDMNNENTCFTLTFPKVNS